MAESGFSDFVSTSWTGLLAPAHTPRDVIDKLNVQINEGLKSAELRSALAKLTISHWAARRRTSPIRSRAISANGRRS